ncbi:MAG: hypothetical protein J2P36_30795, partial [Ktedonobacteraceae bacterium]|nr:hypothetical protein [Ktedonobacteraceae bacterium]
MSEDNSREGLGRPAEHEIMGPNLIRGFGANRDASDRSNSSIDAYHDQAEQKIEARHNSAKQAIEASLHRVDEGIQGIEAYRNQASTEV